MMLTLLRIVSLSCSIILCHVYNLIIAEIFTKVCLLSSFGEKYVVGVLWLKLVGEVLFSIDFILIDIKPERTGD